MAKKKKSATVSKTAELIRAKAEARKKLMKKRVAPKIVARKKTVKTETESSPIVERKKAGYPKKELDHFRQIINEKKKEIIEELETLRDTMMDAATGEYVGESSSYSLHMEQGTDAMEREKTFLFASREGKFLNYLEDALKRIESGAYGRCLECGKLIEKERLEAVPHAQMCVKCKMRRGR